MKHCVVYSEGEFLDESLSTNKEKAEEVFGDMLEHLTQEASRSCVLIEFRNLNNSMFGYRVFRTNDYFPSQLVAGTQFAAQYEKDGRPVQPVAHPSDKKKGLKNGAKVEEAHTVEEIHDFSRMLHKVYSPAYADISRPTIFSRHMNNMLIKGQQAKNIRCEIQKKKSLAVLCLYLFGRRRIPLVFREE